MEVSPPTRYGQGIREEVGKKILGGGGGERSEWSRCERLEVRCDPRPAGYYAKLERIEHVQPWMGMYLQHCVLMAQ